MKKIKRHYLCVDTETTGLFADKNAILEIGAVPLTLNGGHLYADAKRPTFRCLVRPHPDAVIHPQAIAVNGHKWVHDKHSKEYRDAYDASGACKAFNDYLEKLFPDRKKGEHIILVGWNVSFDEDFLRALYDRTAKTLSADLLTPEDVTANGQVDDPKEAQKALNALSYPFHYEKIDLIGVCHHQDLIHNRHRQSYSLSRISKYYFGDGLAKFAMHTAMGDAQMSLRVLQAVMDDDRSDITIP